MEVSETWVNERFDFQNYDTAWVGYTSADRNKLGVTYIGRWIGWNSNGVLADLRFKHFENNRVQMLRRIYAGLLGIYQVLYNFHGVMGKAQIFTNSLRSAEWFNDGVSYKRNGLWFTPMLVQLYQLMGPTIQTYDHTLFPFNVIKESVSLELKFHGLKAGGYQSLADLCEVGLE